ncbi:hypothetical protein [Paraburkholderia bannensis]|uniref:hypothetical protein n=1 Tax=Paraburkholderia bannensis TaxID=765414 RepID=UPI002ABD43D6|nr:hypothetical protein [Paraburkholderia bannensis]
MATITHKFLQLPSVFNSAIALGSVGGTKTMTVPLVAQSYRLGMMMAGTVAATGNFTDS